MLVHALPPTVMSQQLLHTGQVTAQQRSNNSATGVEGAQGEEGWNAEGELLPGTSSGSQYRDVLATASSPHTEEGGRFGALCLRSQDTSAQAAVRSRDRL